MSEETGRMFWWLMVTMVVVVAGSTLAVLGSGDGRGGRTDGGLPEAAPDRPDDPLPLDRPVEAADIVALRLPVGARGYRMAEVDDVLDRLAAELAERDARIDALQEALAGHRGREDQGPDDAHSAEADVAPSATDPSATDPPAPRLGDGPESSGRGGDPPR